MICILFWIWATVATIWAVIATVMLIRNPFPFPDRGHRVYGVPNERAREVVVGMLQELGRLRARFTFDAGPTHQTLMWDSYTVINLVDQKEPNLSRLSGTGLSIPVKDPRAAAETAIRILNAEGFRAQYHEIQDDYILPNHLIVVESKAFNEWVLVFRRHILKMPAPKKRKNTRYEKR